MLTEKCNCEGCELKTLFFGNVSNDDIESVCTRKSEKVYSKGEFIIREGDEISDFIYMKSGLVKLYRTGNNGEEQIITFAGPLDFVSLLSVFSEKKYNYSVVALDDSTVCSLNLDEVKDIASDNGRFAISILEKVNKATDTIIRTFLEIKQRRLNGRIAYILLYFANDIYKSDTFELPVSRKEIGEFIGMTIENVIRTLSDFRKDGIIKISGKTIEITDKARLTRIREFS